MEYGNQQLVYLQNQINSVFYVISKIDEIIKYILTVYTRKYYTITGDTKERYNQIDKILKEYGKANE